MHPGVSHCDPFHPLSWTVATHHHHPDPHQVGVFQQLMVGCGDWSVRCALLQALGRSGPEVLGRVVESSKVLDALHTWLQASRWASTGEARLHKGVGAEAGKALHTWLQQASAEQGARLAEICTHRIVQSRSPYDPSRGRTAVEPHMRAGQGRGRGAYNGPPGTRAGGGCSAFLLMSTNAHLYSAVVPHTARCSPRVVDSLPAAPWSPQEALDDGQGTVLRLLLGVMGQLPVSRVMLRVRRAGGPAGLIGVRSGSNNDLPVRIRVLGEMPSSLGTDGLMGPGS